MILIRLRRLLRSLVSPRVPPRRPPAPCDEACYAGCGCEQEPLAIPDSELREEPVGIDDTQYVDWQRIRKTFIVPDGAPLTDVYARRIYCPWCKEWTTLVAGPGSIDGEPFPCGCGVVVADYFNPELPWFDEEGRRWTR